MKRTFTFLLGCLFSSSFLFSQFTLTSSTHGLKAGDVQVMLKAEYVEAGLGGPKQVWNFSGLKLYGSEKSKVLDASTVEKYGIFPSSTVALSVDTDFRGMYRISGSANDHVGYYGKDYYVIYNQPHRRMIYPFSYGEYYQSYLSGYGVYGESSTDISGDYSFEADGYGTLILPNDVLPDVLRVKSTLSKYEFARCAYTETHQTKYLYYTSQHRYPVFSILETMWVNYQGDTSWHRSSAVNELVYHSDGDTPEKESPTPVSVQRKDYVHHVFPNPFNDEFTVKFELEESTSVSVELYSLEGIKIGDVCTRRVLPLGVHEFEYRASALPSGAYFIKFIFNETAFVKQVIKVK